MKWKLKISLLIASLSLVGFFVFTTCTHNTFAQSVQDTLGIEEQVDLEVLPQNPQPGQQLTATIEAPGTNLNEAKVSWYVNGALKSSGTGMTTFTTNADTVGKSLLIDVKITTSAGDVIDRSTTISAQNVDIIWEGDSYTPPFYKGQALYGQEGDVTFVAMPNIVNKRGVRVDPSTLTYKWSVDNSVQGSKSGYGKNSFSFSGSILGNETQVKVEVAALDGTTGQGIVSIAPQKPSILFYENNALYGTLFNEALTDGYKLKNKEIKVEAFPYFESALNKISSNLSYSWTLNNDPIPVPSQKNSATFRNANGVGGSSLVSVIIENTTHVFQQAQASVTLNF